ncbi:MAG: DUF1294 domain-containing protein [Rhodoglobus sp.]
MPDARDLRDGTLHDGTLAIWKDDRGFGFIQPAEGGSRIFVNIRDFLPGAPRPTVGDVLRFQVAHDPDGRARAVAVVSTRAARETPELPRATTRPRFRFRGRELLGWIIVVVFIALLCALTMFFHLPLWVDALYLLASIACFVAYASDKSAAMSGQWRISETRLLSLGLIGGWPGAIIAQRILRHKTRKLSFISIFWVTVAVNVIALVVFGWPPLLHLLVMFATSL